MVGDIGLNETTRIRLPTLKSFLFFSKAKLAQKQGLIGHAMLSLGRTSSLTSIILMNQKKIILKTSYTGPLSHAYALLMSNLIPTLDLLISTYEAIIENCSS